MGRQKKNEVIVQEIDAPFVDEHNKDYITVSDLKLQAVDG